MNWINILLHFGTFFYCCNTYKILFIYHMPTGSHYILASKLGKEIAKRGHEVTFITPYSQTNPIKNVKEIPIESLQTVLQGGMPTFKLESATPLEKAKYLMGMQINLTERLLSNSKIQELMRSEEHYDAVILYHYLNDAMLALAHHFKAPVVLFSSMPVFVSESFLLSHPNPSSYVPNILTEYTGRMNFWQRLRNSFYDIAMILYYQWFILPKHRELVHKYIPGKPELYDLLNNASVILINSHVSTNEAIPLVPNAIEIGGYHIEEPKPLPENLQTFLDDSVNGVIVFSMGSIMRTVEFPIEKRDELLKTFSKLKQNVLWKWEDENLPGVPKNVKIMKWIPQSDVLAHSNVKAFISHGGLLSTMESVYYAVPIVGIPVFVDQKMNMALARLYEYAVEVPYVGLTEEKLSQALNQVLNDPKYKNNIKERSRIMRDRPIKPLDNALYWIEYVIRHQGAPHLRYPGMDLNWFQRNLLDVVVFAIILILAPIFGIISFLKRMRTDNNKSKTE